VIRTPSARSTAITALNFSRGPVEEDLNLSEIKELERKPSSGQLVDIVTGKRVGELSMTGRMTINLAPLGAQCIVMEKPAD
jgi:hypothetical protein